LIGFKIKEVDLSSEVLAAFSDKCPNAKEVEWEADEKEYKAEFEMNGHEYSASFLVDGTWLETEQEITKNKLPLAVKESLKREFSGYRFDEVEKVERPNFNSYEVLMEKKEKEIEVLIDENGKIVSQEEESDNE
jgi:hypothetical protein